MHVIYCYNPNTNTFDTFVNLLWAYYRTRPFVMAELQASESVWIVPGTIQVW